MLEPNDCDICLSQVPEPMLEPMLEAMLKPMLQPMLESMLEPVIEARKRPCLRKNFTELILWTLFPGAE